MPLDTERKFMLTGLGIAGGFGLLAWYFYDKKDKAQKTAQGEPIYLPIVKEAAAATNVPANILAGIVTAESSWSNAPNRYSDQCGVSCIASKAGAVGLAQLLPSTASSMGVSSDLCEPRNNLLAAGRYLRRLYQKYGDWHTSALAYNWGPGNVDQWLAGKKSAYSGSVAYADKVVKAADKYAERGIAGLDRLGLVPVASVVPAMPTAFAAPVGQSKISLMRLRLATA